MMQAIEPAALSWQGSTPFNDRYHDVYYSHAGGLAEAEHVFIRGNALCQRWQQGDPLRPFVIAETGFGSGLNFFATWAAWQALPCAPPLHYLAIEKHPWSLDDLQRLRQHWPQLSDQITALCAQYPPLFQGWHRLQLGRVRLSLIFADVLTGLSQMHSPVDAWFLDGFSPRNNPDMWQTHVLQQVARLSHAHSTLATFTAARQVKQGLSALGFRVSKQAGFGPKRDMITATYAGLMGPERRRWSWYVPPRAAAVMGAKPITEVAVIGAGLAGAQVAWALTQRGLQVHLFEQHAQVAQQASAHRQAVLYAKLGVQPSPHCQFYAQGLDYSARLLRQFFSDCWQPCGVLQLAYDAAEQQRQQRFIQAGLFPSSLLRPVTAKQAQALAGIPIQAPGLFCAQGGYVDVPRWCEQLCQAAKLWLDTLIERIDWDETAGRWQLHSAQGLHQADAVVIANATQARQFAQTAALPLHSIRGQTTALHPVPSLMGLRAVVCGESSIAPYTAQGLATLGATFDRQDADPWVRLSSHQHNLHSAVRLLPHLSEDELVAQLYDGQVGFRCCTPDYLPVVGPVPQAPNWHHPWLQRKHHGPKAQPDLYYPRLYCSLGHGSKGLCSTALSAELLVALICDEPWPLAGPVLAALHPARFMRKPKRSTS